MRRKNIRKRLVLSFCGISIIPIAPVKESDADISNESTIAVSGAELEELKKNTGLDI